LGERQRNQTHCSSSGDTTGIVPLTRIVTFLAGQHLFSFQMKRFDGEPHYSNVTDAAHLEELGRPNSDDGTASRWLAQEGVFRTPRPDSAECASLRLARARQGAGSSMNLQNVDVEVDVNDNVLQGHALWNAGETAKNHPPTATRPLNARVVEFIAKPGKVELLEECLRGHIMEFLNRQRGFAGAIILNSHQEQRVILVVSFWTTKRMSEENCWERSRVVRQAAGYLIDVCSKVHTYQAALANSFELKQENATSQVMRPEVQG
jgi:hypothetical protein